MIACQAHSVASGRGAVSVISRIAARLSRGSILTLPVTMCLLAGQCPLSAAELAGPRYLIIHADDAGMSHSANVGTINALENGIVSSTSIMVPCPWFTEFAAYAKTHPQYDYGVHLTLNCEWQNYRWGPVAPRGRVPSLVDQRGHLWRDVRQVAEHAVAAEVEIELRAQIERAKQSGIPLTHLDTHMGAVLSRPDLLEIYVKLGIEYGLPVMFIRQVDEAQARQYPTVAAQASRIVRRLDEHGLPVLDHVAQFYGGDTQGQRREDYLRLLRTLPAGTSQLIIHCGYDNEELRAITSSAANRDGDRRIFTDPEIIAEVKKQGIRVITWKQLRQLRR